MSFDLVMKAIMENGGGVIGVLLVVMLWFNYNLVTKLFKVIETNTEVITGIKSTLSIGNDLIKNNTDLIGKHQMDDQRHRDQAERTHEEVHRISLTLTDMGQSLDTIYNKVVKG